VIVAIVAIVVVVAGLGRRLAFRRRWGSRTWLAFVLVLFPFPVLRAMGRFMMLMMLGWFMAWSTAGFVLVPVVGVGTLGMGGRRW